MTEVSACSALIGTHFEIDLPGKELDKNELLSVLTEEIQKLLDQDFNRLLNILYRIDLEEHQVKSILTKSSPDDMAHQLALSVIDRQLKKIQTRSAYKGQ